MQLAMKHDLTVLLAAIVLGAAPGLTQAQPKPAPSPAVDDSEVDPPVTALDLEVIARARQLLNSPTVWNRNDTRQCPKPITRYSLYCAIEIATLEVEGTFAHRGAAMQQARFVVDEVTAKRDYRHRLKDYNNDPTTTFSDMTHIFDLTEARIRAKLATQGSPPKQP